MILFKQNGMAAIEFIASMPILFLLMIATLDFGQAFIDYTVLDKAVRAGARHAVRDGISSSDIKNIVVYGTTDGAGDDNANKPKLKNLVVGNVTVDKTTINGYVTVSVTYVYVPFFPKVPVADISLRVPLTASAVMRTMP